MNSAYCSMIHGGLHLDFKNSTSPVIQHCCLRKGMAATQPGESLWNHRSLQDLRQKNKQGQWDSGCSGCQRLEQSGQMSMRTGMNQGLGMDQLTDLSGPARIDLMFDISCNLACRTCDPDASTLWQRYLRAHDRWTAPISTGRSKQDVIAALSQLDLANLRQLVFCGGETLLGQQYWDVAEWLVDHVPNAKQQLTISFQTNGTQSIAPRNFDIIDRAHLVKLHISLDGTAEQFEYLRWPAQWNQVTDNIQEIRRRAPSNVMFLIEETVSIFNLYYTDRLSQWAQSNFSANREGDVVNHTRHFAHGIYSLNNCSQEYVDHMRGTAHATLIPQTWSENPDQISAMIKQIAEHDAWRQQSFATTFPAVAEFYRRFL